MRSVSPTPNAGIGTTVTLGRPPALTLRTSDPPKIGGGPILPPPPPTSPVAPPPPARSSDIPVVKLEKPKLIPVPERPKVPPPAAERPAAAVAPEIPQSAVVPGKEQVADPPSNPKTAVKPKLGTLPKATCTPVPKDDQRLASPVTMPTTISPRTSIRFLRDVDPPPVVLSWPPALKALLVADRTAAPHKQAPPRRGGPPSVAAILTEFAATLQPSCDPDHVTYFIGGLKKIFNATVERCLLYPGEPHFMKAETTDNRPAKRTKANPDPASSLADSFSGIHLLRLLVRLPVILQQYLDLHAGKLEGPAREVFQRHLDGLLFYLDHHAPRLLPPR